MGGIPRVVAAWLDIGIDAAGRSPHATMEAVLLHLRYLLVGPYPSGPLAGATLTSQIALRVCMMVTTAGVGRALLLDRLDATLGLRRLARLLRGLLATLRAIPVLTLMFWAYFLIPMTLGASVPKTTTVVVAPTAVGAAYITQSMEANLRVVGVGQRSTALAPGMLPLQVLLTAVLPQAWRIMLSSLANQRASTAKDISLAYIVGVVELFTAASQVNSHTMACPAEVFGAVAVLYFLPCTGIEALPNWLRAGPRMPAAQPTHMPTW